MYDNVDFRLRNTDVSDTDFLSETPRYLDAVTGEHDFNGDRVVSGILGNTLNDNYYKITISRQGVNIKNGSLCKYYLGDNFKTLVRADTQRAIEKLADTLHLPIEKATVTRLDIAQNFIVRNPVQVYYNHPGELKYSTRSPITNGAGDIEGMYYFKRLGLLLFYNKVKEQRDKGQPIPELYQNRNVLRYEQRYKNNLSKSFNVERVTAAMLFDEAFYINVINLWKENYFNIKKINDISLNFEAMKGKTDLYNMGVLALVQMQGGELNFISQINEAQKSGQLSRKQAFDMRQAVTAACKTKDGITAKNEAITELDKKIVEAVKFYR
jgi:hypothetical protein